MLYKFELAARLYRALGMQAQGVKEETPFTYEELVNMARELTHDYEELQASQKKLTTTNEAYKEANGQLKVQNTKLDAALRVFETQCEELLALLENQKNEHLKTLNENEEIKTSSREIQQRDALLELRLKKAEEELEDALLELDFEEEAHKFARGKLRDIAIMAYSKSKQENQRAAATIRRLGTENTTLSLHLGSKSKVLETAERELEILRNSRYTKCGTCGGQSRIMKQAKAHIKCESCDALRERCQTLESEKSKTVAEWDRLRVQCEKLGEEIKALEEAKASALRQSVEEVSKKLAEQQKIASLQQYCEEHEADYGRHMDEMRMLVKEEQAEKKKLVVQSKYLRSQHEKDETHIKTLNGRIESLTEETKLLTHQSQKLTGRIQALDESHGNAIAKLKKQISKKEEIIQDLIAAIKARTEELQRYKGGEKPAAEALEGQLERQQRKYNQLKAECENLSQQLETAKNEIAALALDGEQKDTRIADLEERLADAGKRIDEAEYELKGARADKAMTKDEVRELRARIESVDSRPKFAKTRGSRGSGSQVKLSSPSGQEVSVRLPSASGSSSSQGIGDSTWTGD